MDERIYAKFSDDRGMDSLRNCTIVIDTTLLFRKRGPNCLRAFRDLEANCSLFMAEDYSSRLLNLLDSTNYQSFFSDEMARTTGDCLELLKQLSVSTPKGRQSAYRLFKQCSGKKVFATGNETEALRHILNDRRGDVLLVTDDSIHLIHDKVFPKFTQACGKMLGHGFYSVPNPADCHTYYGTNNSKFPVDGILSTKGKEGVLFRSGQHVLKCYWEKLTSEKVLKLRRMTRLPSHKLDRLVYAWPRELVMATPDGKVAGFTMEQADFTCMMDDALCGYELSDFDRWELAVNFTAQVLYLYLFDIQIGDYNRDNFGICDDLSITFMDTDSYITGCIGTQVKANSRIRYPADYSRKADVIAADYHYLHATVFYLLTGGRWPYYFSEPEAPGDYILRKSRSRNAGDERIYKTMPPQLQGYFSKILDRQQLGDPFELYEYLLQAESQYKDGLTERNTRVDPELLFDDDSDEPRKRSWFRRIFG